MLIFTQSLHLTSLWTRPRMRSATWIAALGYVSGRHRQTRRVQTSRYEILQTLSLKMETSLYTRFPPQVSTTIDTDSSTSQPYSTYPLGGQYEQQATNDSESSKFPNKRCRD